MLVRLNEQLCWKPLITSPDADAIAIPNEWAGRERNDPGDILFYLSQDGMFSTLMIMAKTIYNVLGQGVKR